VALPFIPLLWIITFGFLKRFAENEVEKTEEAEGLISVTSVPFCSKKSLYRISQMRKLFLSYPLARIIHVAWDKRA